MENTEKKSSLVKMIAIGCGGCAFVSCLGIIGTVAIFSDEIIEFGEAIEDLDSLSVPMDILALPDGGSSVWDAQVKNIMVTNFDTDQSGFIDTPDEVGRIECDVWNAINLSLLSSGEYTTNFTAVYGFDPELIWLGNELGFDESVRALVASQAPPCFSVTAEELMVEDTNEFTVDVDDSFMIFDPSKFTFGDTAQAILNLPNGGSDQWDISVKEILLAKYDRTGNGSLDVSGEINVISCDIWAALDIGMRSGGGYSSSVYTVYGFEPSLNWIGYTLGFADGMRAEAFAKASDCHQAQ